MSRWTPDQTFPDFSKRGSARLSLFLDKSSSNCPRSACLTFPLAPNWRVLVQSNQASFLFPHHSLPTLSIFSQLRPSSFYAVWLLERILALSAWGRCPCRGLCLTCRVYLATCPCGIFIWVPDLLKLRWYSAMWAVVLLDHRRSTLYSLYCLIAIHHLILQYFQKGLWLPLSLQ